MEENQEVLERQSFYESQTKEIIDGTILFVMEHLQEEENMCYELFHRLTDSPEYAAYALILCVKQISKTVQARFEGMSGVSITEYGSCEFAEYLATAKIVISNTMLPEYYMCRQGQRYVDIPGENRERSVSQLLNATFLISRGDSYTKEVYEQRYHLQGLYQGTILEYRGEGMDAFLRQVIAVAVYEEPGQAAGKICWGESGKQRLLFVIDVEKEKTLTWEQYKALMNQLSEENYEVTLLVTKKESAVIKGRLYGLKKSIHRVFRQGGAGYEEWEPQTEWRRMLGNAGFDFAYLTAPNHHFWYRMFPELTCDHIVLLYETSPRDWKEYQAGILFDRMVAMNYATYQDILQSGEVEERKVELFDLQFCLLRSKGRFLSVMLAGTEYLECGMQQLPDGSRMGSYMKAPSLSRTSMFVSVAGLSEDNQKAAIEACYEFVRENPEEEVYIETTEQGFGLEEERLTLIPQEIVTVELLERLDVILSVTREEDYKYGYIAALIKKPFGNVKIKEEAAENVGEETKSLLKTKGTYHDGRKEGIYLKYQREEMKKLLY